MRPSNMGSTTVFQDNGSFLNDRMLEVLLAHGIQRSDCELFLKSLVLSNDNAYQTPSYDYLQSAFSESFFAFFELSNTWLSRAGGLSEHIPVTLIEPNDPASALIKLIQYLIEVKQKGWNPQLIFVRSDIQVERNEAPLIFIELSKMIPTGMGVTTYKPWESSIWQQAFLLCREAYLYVRGVYLDQVLLSALKNHQILPVNALKNAKDLWYPEKHLTVDLNPSFSEDVMELIQALRHTSLHPTHLTNRPKF